jgi:hypothetical protein
VVVEASRNSAAAWKCSQFHPLETAGGEQLIGSRVDTNRQYDSNKLPLRAMGWH